jgi:transcriptional regulator GlxA family with amidase domain
MAASSGPIRVVILAFDGVNLLDVSGPLQAFAAAETHRGAAARYETIVATVEGGEIQTSAHMPIVTRKLADLEHLAIDTVMIGGGSPNGRPAEPPELIRWIAKREGQTRRLCSICTGTFMLAATGLLDGRRATTHWQWARLLQQENPTIEVTPDSIYVNDGKIWTSAGVTAGIDLTLALIEQDYGYRVAIEVARRLVVFMKRPGGQAQFSVPLLMQSQKDDSFAELHAWIRQNLGQDLKVNRLAEKAGMSERSFSRAYVARVGHTPAKTVEAMRFEAACGLLESTQLALKQIAALAGFGEEQNLRRVFVRRFGLNPVEYRQRFSSTHQPTDKDSALQPSTLAG